MDKRKIILIALLSLVLLWLAPSLHAASPVPPCVSGSLVSQLPPWYCNQINGAVENVWVNYAPIVLIAVFLSFLIAVVIFMGGTVLRNEHIRNFGVGELYEAAATALIAILFMLLAAVLFGLIPALTAGPVNPYVTALGYISNTLSVSNSTIVAVYNIIMVDTFYGSIGFAVTVEGQQYGATSLILSSLIFAIYSFFIIPARAIIYLLLDGMLILYFQFYLILFFMYAAIPVFLVPGIVFRAIFPVRNVGGIMIGIAISFYMIMPLLFSVAYYFTNTGLISTLGSESQLIQIHGAGTLAESNAASSSGLLVQDIGVLQSAMGSFWLAILFYPALIGAIGYESIRIIAEFIGGAVRTTGKLRGI